ncbi:protealysin inhibitor emfourin [Microbacterium sp. SGAir0570]|uniref:protealysin inhibitor emfourin n=1 Tax=Microbacterium sp. SGAir0570 TaxID=2070348 RepID=UPI00215B1150|nr:protealysin inhibitor emfourin [Microbacterium sp. SGAir0570]
MPDTRDDGSTAELRIVVERTGGFAGLTRTWRVEPAPAESACWRELVGRCPWQEIDASAPAGKTGSSGADRFHWRIAVTDSETTRQAELNDDLDEPWRSLVDAVRTGRSATPGGVAEE